MKNEGKAAPSLLDADGQEKLPDLIGHLPEPVKLEIFGDPHDASVAEALRLGHYLSRTFETIEFGGFPPRINYPYYPVIAVKGFNDESVVDYGVRLIGLPAGFQLTSLIAAIQSVSFRGMTAEPVTRIALHRLEQEIILELITSAEDEFSPIMAQRIFNMAVASQKIRSFLIMGDQFPEALLSYSVSHVPHLVINKKVHIESVVDESTIIKHIGIACGQF